MRNCLFALAALVAGCHWALNDKGTDPQAAQLYFPSGIAMDPSGHYVYVSNGNADLRYGGGTVVMVDMLSFECTIAEFRRYSPVDPMFDPSTRLPEICLRDDHQPAYWDDLAVRAKCKHDALDPSIIDCDESAFILQNSTVRIGNFAGAIRLLDDPDPMTGKDRGHRTLFVAVRGDPSITEIQVHLPGSSSAKFAPQDINDPGVLQCVPDPSSLAHRAQYDPTLHLTSAPAPCDVSFLVQDYTCQGLPSCVTGTDQNNKNQLPTEPFGMQLDPSTGHLLVSHLATGQVSVIDARSPTPTEALLSESTAFFPPDPTGRHGAFSLAQQNPADAHSLWYLTSNVNPLIATFRVGDSNLVIPQSTFAVNTSFAQGGDVRDILFDTGGNRAFATDANPPTVAVIDTRTDATAGSQPHNVITDIVDVCQTPSHTGVRRFVVAGAPGTPARLKTKLVVVCFVSSQLMIVDPDRPGVDATVFSGLSGPNDIAFNFTDDGVAHPVAQIGVPRHAYVTNYSESTLAVVDLEPGSPTENRVLARLGFPPDGLNP